MKLLRAVFKNFRLLRDVEIDFSADEEQKLTVVRAANESGKTTMHRALQWALYGDNALPRGGKGFRLRPIMAHSSQQPEMRISVEIDYEKAVPMGLGVVKHQKSKRYRIVRTAHESMGAEFVRTTTAQMFELGESGAAHIQNPDTIINSHLPNELREVFFTDGDSALSFIDTDLSTADKRRRVEHAIRSLLDIGLIESAVKHVQVVEREANKDAKSVDPENRELQELVMNIEENEKQLDIARANIKRFEIELSNLDTQIPELEKEIEAILKKGNKHELRKELEETRKAIKAYNVRLLDAKKMHADLFRDSGIALEIVSPYILKAVATLTELHDARQIPSTTIPVLSDRLKLKKCICGESLDVADRNAQRRIEHIEELINTAKTLDSIREAQTRLYYSVSEWRPQPGDIDSAKDCLAKIADATTRRISIERDLDTLARRRKDLDSKIAQLADVNLESRQKKLNVLRERHISITARLAADKANVHYLIERLAELGKLRTKLIQKKSSGQQVLTLINVSSSIKTVLNDILSDLTAVELVKASRQMNDLFLKMIKAVPAQGAIVQRAEINSDFDIVVYGLQNNILTPDKDLNGASRRALTLAFILAITRISKFEAPNVIDTPLGMTSGAIRREILKVTLNESDQLILFLTHDEIRGCEEILNRWAGREYTLTNTTHYPAMLVNEPKVGASGEVLICTCNHCTTCDLCARRG